MPRTGLDRAQSDLRRSHVTRTFSNMRGSCARRATPRWDAVSSFVLSGFLHGPSVANATHGRSAFRYASGRDARGSKRADRGFKSLRHTRDPCAVCPLQAAANALRRKDRRAPSHDDKNAVNSSPKGDRLRQMKTLRTDQIVIHTHLALRFAEPGSGRSQMIQPATRLNVNRTPVLPAPHHSGRQSWRVPNHPVSLMPIRSLPHAFAKRTETADRHRKEDLTCRKTECSSTLLMKRRRGS